MQNKVEYFYFTTRTLRDWKGEIRRVACWRDRTWVITDNERLIYRIGRDCFETEAEARADVLARLTRKRDSLNSKLAVLSELRLSVVDTLIPG